MIRRKYESLDGIYPDIEEYYDTQCNYSNFADERSIIDTTEDCIEYLVTDCGYDENVVSSDRWYLKIKRYLLNLARGNESCKREAKKDKCEEDECCEEDETCKESLERRVSKLERLLLNK